MSILPLVLLRINLLETLVYYMHWHTVLVTDDVPIVFSGSIAIFVKPVNVSRGARVVLTTDVLLATDGTDKPEELQYVITNPPAHGHIEYIKHPGLVISTFSQMDIAANLVGYVHDNRASMRTENFQYVQDRALYTTDSEYCQAKYPKTRSVCLYFLTGLL